MLFGIGRAVLGALGMGGKTDEERKWEEMEWRASHASTWQERIRIIAEFVFEHENWIRSELPERWGYYMMIRDEYIALCQRQGWPPCSPHRLAYTSYQDDSYVDDGFVNSSYIDDLDADDGFADSSYIDGPGEMHVNYSDPDNCYAVARRHSIPEVDYLDDSYEVARRNSILEMQQPTITMSEADIPDEYLQQIMDQNVHDIILNGQQFHVDWIINEHGVDFYISGIEDAINSAFHEDERY